MAMEDLGRMIRGKRRRWRTDSGFGQTVVSWRLLFGLLVWAGLFLLWLRLGPDSYFVIGKRGEHIIPMGLFELEKRILTWSLHAAFAGWLLCEVLDWVRAADMLGRVAAGIAIAYVPIVVVMSRPELLVPWLPEGARAHSESRLRAPARLPPPVPLFRGDPLIARETRA